MAKIIWQNNNSLEEHSGGAQQTNAIMIEEGRKRGHDIIELTKSNSERLQQELIDCDYVILNNLADFKLSIIRWIIDNKPYIRYEHDYDSINLMMQHPEIENLFNNSLLNIFLSPLHMNEFISQGVSIDKSKTHLQPSPVKGFYKDENIKRDYSKILWVGNICWTKGLTNILNFAKAMESGALPEKINEQFEKFDVKQENLKIQFYGWGSDETLNELKKHPNCEYMGEVKNDELNSVYNSAGWFIHMPSWKEPFGRTLVEAAIAGCQLITKDSHIGARSYDDLPWDSKGLQNVNEKLPNKFWDKIESVIEEKICYPHS